MPDAVFLDMDNTIADLYNVPNWLDYLMDEDTYPYDAAEPMFDLLLLDDLIRLIQSMGVRVGVVSWASKGSSKEYHREVAKAKRDWLAKHLPSVREVHVVAYGTPKAERASVRRNAVLVDDDDRVRAQWDSEKANRTSIKPENCLAFMADLARQLVEMNANRW